MIRKERAVGQDPLITRVLQNATICRLGLAQDNTPYVVPVAYGYDGERIYFHTGLSGHKLNLIAANNLVCFEMELGVDLFADPSSPCHWSFSYETVIGTGLAHELLDHSEKAAGLQHIVGHYAPGDWSFEPEQVRAVRVWRISILQVSGKKSSLVANQDNS